MIGGDPQLQQVVELREARASLHECNLVPVDPTIPPYHLWTKVDNRGHRCHLCGQSCRRLTSQQVGIT